ncbi:hypothetical protein M0R45_036375 [Rubus argutus]|uniref:Uncharacterized protein n=1 Tax=Rubus argutus TaxID=59490 RepID=A0AAW1VYM9_RUBAR
MEGIQHRTIKVNGINMHVAEKGQGPVWSYSSTASRSSGTPGGTKSTPWPSRLPSCGAGPPRLRRHGSADRPFELHVFPRGRRSRGAVGRRSRRPGEGVRGRARLGCEHRLVSLPVSAGPGKGDIEAEFSQIGTARVMKELLTNRHPGPLFLPKGKGFGHPLDDPIALPSWLSEDDVNYYASFFEKKGFTGGINYYRNLDRNWELHPGLGLK